MQEGVEDRLLDSCDVAAILNVTKRWVEEHTRLGDIPHIRLGRFIRYRRDALLAWIQDQEQEAFAMKWSE
jgi:excisionase family DNA binding protein